MKYVDFIDDNGVHHHYGLYVSYTRSMFNVTLVENKKYVTDLTTIFRKSGANVDGLTTAFVSVSRCPFAERLLEEAGFYKTGREYDSNFYGHLVEYDFTKLARFNDKEMHRDKMKPGMVSITDCLSISTSIIYYAYHDKARDAYRIVATTGDRYKLTKEMFVKAIKEYNIPVYKGYRKEPFEYEQTII